MNDIEMGEGNLDYMSRAQRHHEGSCHERKGPCRGSEEREEKGCETNQRNLEILHLWLEDERSSPKPRNSGGL